MKQPNEREVLILAIETSTAIGSIAVFQGEQLMGSVEIRRAKSHARLLMPMIEQLLGKLEISPKELDAIGVSKGPGSYTGLRVGVSTAKGLCMALDKPLLALGSLETLASKVRTLAHTLDAWIIPMLDARRMEVYTGVFDSDLKVELAVQPMIIEAGALEKYATLKSSIFLGDGVAKCRKILSQYPKAILLPEALSSARDMGKELLRLYQEEVFEELHQFEPFYLKSFVATKSKKKFF